MNSDRKKFDRAVTYGGKLGLSFSLSYRRHSPIFKKIWRAASRQTKPAYLTKVSRSFIPKLHRIIRPTETSYHYQAEEPPLGKGVAMMRASENLNYIMKAKKSLGKRALLTLSDSFAYSIVFECTSSASFGALVPIFP